jgi:parallel beta-helix repeat protein
MTGCGKSAGWVMVLAVLAGAACPSCTRTNPAYCASNLDCPDPLFPVCDPTISGCVGLPQPDIIVDETSCPEEGQGTDHEPYCSIQVAIDNARMNQVIRVREGTYSENLQIAENLTLQGDSGAQLVTSDCPGIQIIQGATVALAGLTVTGTGGIRVTGASQAILEGNSILSTSCVGIDCLGQSNCRIVGNRIRGNTDGGVKVSGAKGVVINNFISSNGSPNKSGGLEIQAPDPASAFVNNSIAGNTPFGVDCQDAAVIWNTILCTNDPADVAGDCTVNYSDVCQDDPPVAGVGNVGDDPQMIDADGGDLCVLPGSPCVDQADPGVAPVDDIDGTARPRGLGPDIGACEAG